MGCGRGDTGQAFPAYVAAVTGLLFLGFAYFLVAQAAVTRNDAQTAADAAALAAAQDAREQLRAGWLDVILDPSQWGAFVRGQEFFSSPACASAADLAVKNGAAMSDCLDITAEGSRGFSVTVRTTGADAEQATASADAVVEARCTFEAPDPTPPPTPTEPAEGEEGDDGEEEEPGPITGLSCRGEPWVIDPVDPELPDIADLFTVRLSD
ncbi:hypothetical protein EAO70_30135 [Streptomyces sp. adm13(2018)]|uniref:pilus assembly protein TadG-related protein n=1 Tax=Streptomyces sp. adm13(2018) TaxID=2479007 RepID=UPI0011CE6142|nr:pilus assembly protein TadG-related protein [Streptomyces sp. adm13(2018)]TXS11228.1 hypothetical protein EAO70_30135 [Streptomyces sp. adm13(2018)]